MLSSNSSLSVDDLQGLISASATDIVTDYVDPDSLPGWDKYTGWGRINADNCLMFADPDHPLCFSVEHFEVQGGGVVVDSSRLKWETTFT
jgi:hypothetical protein